MENKLMNMNMISKALIVACGANICNNTSYIQTSNFPCFKKDLTTMYLTP